MKTPLQPQAAAGFLFFVNSFEAVPPGLLAAS
jgi:hypothetical protein